MAWPPAPTVYGKKPSAFLLAPDSTKAIITLINLWEEQG
jgi:hypothetical protein